MQMVLSAGTKQALSLIGAVNNKGLTVMRHSVRLLNQPLSAQFLAWQFRQCPIHQLDSQTKYACEVLERAGMMNCNPCKTPADTDSKLGPDGDPVSDPSLYRSLVGSLQYLTFTRPDLSYAVQQVCLYMHDPREPHLSAMKRILRYVRGTLDHGLQLYISPTSQLIAYSDADWAGCPTTRREYRSVANAVAETAWVRNLIRELLVSLRTTTMVYHDNVGAIYLSCNPVQHQRTKHIEIDIHFVRDFVATSHVRVLHVPLRYQSKDDDVAWWIDLGATTHVSKDRCWLKTYESLYDGSILHMGNESTALVHGRGCVDLSVMKLGNDNCIILCEYLLLLLLCDYRQIG
ncbi:ribonuclease H-like domain-containing protein [Tanacetum coccineum]